MSGHTPGPWVSSIRNGQLWVVHPSGAMERSIARIGDPLETDKANARLIAAAPDLLEALKECSDRLRIHMKHTEDLMADMKAQKAIAKAEGR